ncbi:P-loop containing nucleoside triphosphate hydrolase protein [Chlamydoabsidia padenii]|nr:P-loop containing nucleoside triphosphate hydrolase protein [Chlamydoabsidia padenii]
MANLIPSIPCPTQEATKTLVLAHRTELLEQAQRQIQRYNPTLNVVIEQGPRKAEVETADVIVASVQTLGRMGSCRLDNYDPTLFKAIIIDEAHHAAASTYTRILNHFGATKSDGAIMVWGCSATVRRHDGISLSDVFNDIAFHMDFLEMIESKWLSPLKITTVETSVDLSHVGIQQQDFKQKELSQAVNVSERNDIIVKSWQKYTQSTNDDDDDDVDNTLGTIRRRKATLAFAVDIAHTLSLCNHFRKNGYAAEYLTSKTPTAARYDILTRFRNGDFPILVNCGILTEGTDIPSIDCILMARPTRSAVLFQQMFGRGMRLSPGKNDCLVIDFVDNFQRSGLVTFPTLMGLDPKSVIQDEDVLLLEKKAEHIYQQQQQQVTRDIYDNPSDDDDQNQTPSHLRFKITEYDDMQDFMTSSSGVGNTVRQASGNAWVAIGDQYALSVLGKGTIMLSQTTNGTWIGSFQRQLSHSQQGEATNGSNANDDNSNKEKKKKSKYVVSRKMSIPLEADTLTSAIQAADTWVRHSLLKSNQQANATSRSARYRMDPITDKQKAILKRYKVDLQQPINKGQAMDLITRLKLGQGKIWQQQAKAKRIQMESLEQQRKSGILLRN